MPVDENPTAELPNNDCYCTLCGAKNSVTIDPATQACTACGNALVYCMTTDEVRTRSGLMMTFVATIIVVAIAIISVGFFGMLLSLGTLPFSWIIFRSGQSGEEGHAIGWIASVFWPLSFPIIYKIQGKAPLVWQPYLIVGIPYITYIALIYLIYIWRNVL